MKKAKLIFLAGLAVAVSLTGCQKKEKNFKNNFFRHPKTVPFILFPYLYFGIQTILQSLKNENMHD